MTYRVTRSRRGGFTLVELMIVVAVVAILSAIALPSYRDYVRRGYRAAAESFLMDVAQRQQQYFMDNRTYADSVDTLALNTPNEVSGHYNVAIVAAGGPPPTFTATATPTGDQVNDACGTLSLNSVGTRSASSGTNCW